MSFNVSMMCFFGSGISFSSSCVSRLRFLFLKFIFFSLCSFRFSLTVFASISAYSLNFFHFVMCASLVGVSVVCFSLFDVSVIIMVIVSFSLMMQLL